MLMTLSVFFRTSMPDLVDLFWSTHV